MLFVFNDLRESAKHIMLNNSKIVRSNFIIIKLISWPEVSTKTQTWF